MQPTPPRFRRVTIADVAELAGVSRGAVSKALNGTGRISEKTAERVRAAARELNWHPSVTAVALRHARTRTVGMVIGRPGDRELSSGSSMLIAGIESVLEPLEYGLMLHLVDPERHDEERRTYENLVRLGRVDGIIIGDSRVNDSRLPLVRSLGLRAALVGVPWTDSSIPHVESPDPGAGVGEAVSHLIALGHTRIAYVGGPDSRVQAIQRQQAFTRTMAGAGLAPIATIATRYSPASAAAHTSQLLDSPERPTAIIFGSDLMALAGVHVAADRGLSVPHDLSVVGYDDLTVSAWSSPPLTTVRRDVPQRGRSVAQLLLRELGHEIEVEPVPDPHLIVRESTAPPVAS